MPDNNPASGRSTGKDGRKLDLDDEFFEMYMKPGKDIAHGDLCLMGDFQRQRPPQRSNKGFDGENQYAHQRMKEDGNGSFQGRNGSLGQKQRQQGEQRDNGPLQGFRGLDGQDFRKDLKDAYRRQANNEAEKRIRNNQGRQQSDYLDTSVSQGDSLDGAANVLYRLPSGQDMNCLPNAQPHGARNQSKLHESIKVHYRIGVVSNRSIKIPDQCFWDALGVEKPYNQKVIAYQKYIERNTPVILTEKKEYVMECEEKFQMQIQSTDDNNDCEILFMENYQPKSANFTWGVKFMIKRKEKSFSRVPKLLVLETRIGNVYCGPFLLQLRKRPKIEFLEFLSGKRLCFLSPMSNEEKNRWLVHSQSAIVQAVINLTNKPVKTIPKPNHVEIKTKEILSFIEPLSPDEREKHVSEILDQVYQFSPKLFESILGKRKRNT